MSITFTKPRIRPIDGNRFLASLEIRRNVNGATMNKKVYAVGFSVAESINAVMMNTTRALDTVGGWYRIY